jgi:hypothetical protein
VRDTIAEAEQVLVDIYRRMPPDVKFKRIFESYNLGKMLAMAGLRELHPQATAEQIWFLWARQHLGNALFEEAYGASPDG